MDRIGPIFSGQFISFLLRTMASDLKVQILILAASHSAANQSSECWRSQIDDAIRTTSAKSSDEILSLPNCNPTPRQLRLILSIKNHKQDWWEGQPRQRSTPTGNEFSLLLRTWTQLSLWEYRDWIALSSNPLPHTPTISPEEPDHKPSPDPRHTRRLVVQIPRPPLWQKPLGAD